MNKILSLNLLPSPENAVQRVDMHIKSSEQMIGKVPWAVSVRCECRRALAPLGYGVGLSGRCHCGPACTSPAAAGCCLHDREFRDSTPARSAAARSSVYELWLSFIACFDSTYCLPRQQQQQLHCSHVGSNLGKWSIKAQ